METHQPDVSEYSDAYCTKREVMPGVKRGFYPPCRFPETRQPVGGRVHEALMRRRLAQQATSEAAMKHDACNYRQTVVLPLCDLSWEMHDTSKTLRCGHVTLYEPLQHHPWSGSNLYAVGERILHDRLKAAPSRTCTVPLPKLNVLDLRSLQ